MEKPNLYTAVFFNKNEEKVLILLKKWIIL